MTYNDFGGRLKLPEMIEIDTTESCNLRCRMCHVSFMPAEDRPMFDISLLPKLKSLKGCHVSVASGFEPLIYPEFDRFMRGLSDFGMKLQIITNGTLLDKKNIDTLLASNMQVINFSFDGIHEKTYEFIRRKSNFSKTIERILDTRRAFEGRETDFFVNSTTMKQNLEETIDVIDFWDKHNFDVIRFLLMVVRYPDAELIQQSLYPIRERAKEIFEKASRHVIQNNLKIVMLRPFKYESAVSKEFPASCDQLYVKSANPRARQIPSYRETYQNGSHPSMKYYDCRSAFNSASIFANGDVQLCYKYTIGNLHNNSFDEIWFGQAADEARKKITGSTADCDACDCFKFGIAFANLDADKIENYFNTDLIPYLNSTDFETGVIHSKIEPKPPRLVASRSGYNIISYADQYIAVPQSIGHMDINTANFSSIPGSITKTTYSEIIQAVDKVTLAPPILIESYREFNIVSYDHSLYGLLQSIGDIDLSQEAVRVSLDELQKKGQCVIASNVEETKKMIDALLAASSQAISS